MASSTSQPAVLVAADPTLYRTGLVSLLNQQWPALALTLTADTSQIIDLIRTQHFQLVIVDDYLPNRKLPALLNCIRQAQSTQKVVVLTTNQQPLMTPTPSHLLVPRHSTLNKLTDALGSFLTTTQYQEAATRKLQFPATHFSSRELEVLRLVVEDLCNQEIADRLYLSVRTVESHRRALLQKSGNRTLAGLVAWALRTGTIA